MAGSGYDISASMSGSSSSAGGATKLGNVTLTGIGGSNGVSVWALVAVLALAYFLFRKK